MTKNEKPQWKGLTAYQIQLRRKLVTGEKRRLKNLSRMWHEDTKESKTQKTEDLKYTYIHLESQRKRKMGQK